jgi:phage terminase Nu1 subunit (DNA packaging protein)
VRATAGFEDFSKMADRGSSSTTKAPETVTAKGLAAVLGVTDRWVRDLEKQGVFAREGRGQYDLTKCVPAYVEWRLKAEAGKQSAPSNDRVRDARAAEIERRMAREDRKIVDIDEAMDAFEDISGELLKFVSGLPAMITRDPSERRRIEDITKAAQGRLATRFGEVAGVLRTGEQIAYPGDEEDAG